MTQEEYKEKKLPKSANLEDSRESEEPIQQTKTEVFIQEKIPFLLPIILKLKKTSKAKTTSENEGSEDDEEEQGEDTEMKKMIDDVR
jgi:hypothetical protein